MTEKSDFNIAYLSSAYFPNIQYISKFLLFREIVIEQFENYQKQSFRNRCVIYGANGPLTLVVPVKKNHGEKTLTKDVQIDYDLTWQHQHWKSIHSAYKNSPFFDYFEDDFHLFFQKKEKYLIDLNNKVTDLILKLLQINVPPHISDSYSTNNITYYDYRETINPKARLSKPDNLFFPCSYHQVFSDRFGFISNLSVVDLLFNEGTESFQIIQKSVVKENS